MIKAVIFDRDGVIVNSESANIGAAAKALEKQGIKITKEEEKWIIGRHQDDYILPFEKKYQFSREQFLKNQREYYIELVHSVPVFREAVDFIHLLYGKNIPLALCTSSEAGVTLDLLKRINLDGYFSVIVTKDDCKKTKPDPESYLLTAKWLGLKPEECLVIEDTNIGLEAAKRAGMKCIVIYNEYTKDQDFSKADMVVNSAKDIDLAQFKFA